MQLLKGPLACQLMHFSIKSCAVLCCTSHLLGIRQASPLMCIGQITAHVEAQALGLTMIGVLRGARFCFLRQRPRMCSDDAPFLVFW